MKAVLQRVAGASVVVEGETIGKIGCGPGDRSSTGAGLVVLLGVEQGDCQKDSEYLAQKTVELRIFADEQGKMNKSVQEVGGSILCISQFTLLADWKKGRRPGFSKAAPPAEGNRLYEHFVAQLRNHGVHVETGSFGAHMEVALVNDGPVTLILEYQSALEKS
ncbi:MAG TPA: D-aminoacyl-tRNA deacylase [Planktothrix sp.]|jgi:D-tyrosyl-tRNA(Tyr) deacylase